MLSDMDEQDKPKVMTLARDLVTPHGYIVVTDRLEEALIENISTLVNETQRLALREHGKLIEHNCGVDFPDHIKDTFKVRINCNTAFWILKCSSKDF